MKLEQGPVAPADVEHQANIAAVLGSEIVGKMTLLGD